MTYSPSPRILRAATLTALLLVVLAAAFELYVVLQPTSIFETYDHTQISLTAAQGAVLFSGDCVDVHWQFEGVREVYLDGQGVVGSGTQTVCADRNLVPTFRVVLPDDSRRIYLLDIPIIAYHPLTWLTITAITTLLVCAGYLFQVRYIRQITAAVLIVGAGIILALMAAHTLDPTPMETIDITNGSYVRYTLEHSLAVQPTDCLQITWDTENVRAVEFNSQGVLGTDSRQVCGGDVTLADLRVTFPDGMRRVFRLGVNTLLYPESIALALVATLMTALASDLLSNFPRTHKRTFLTRYDLVAIALIVLLGLVVFAPVVARMSFLPGKTTDFFDHIRWSGDIIELGTPIEGTYYMFHLSVAYISQLSPRFGLQLASVMVITMAYIGFMLGGYFTLRSVFGLPASLRTALLFIGLVLIVLIAAPVSALFSQNLRNGGLYPNTYHNPTSRILIPFALILFNYAVLVFRKSSLQASVVMPALIAQLALLAKPSYTILLLPVLCLCAALYWWRGGTINWRLLILGIVIPSVVNLGLQYYFEYGSGREGNSIAFLPFVVYSVRLPEPWPLWILPVILQSLLFPALLLASYFRAAIKDDRLILAWLIFLAGLTSYLLLGEIGRLNAGNFSWGMQITLLLLFFASIIFFVQRIRERFDRRAVLCLIALALHVVAGLVWYAFQLQPTL